MEFVLSYIKSIYFRKEKIKNSVKRNYLGREVLIDRGILNCVDAINRAGIKTLYSCQGYLERNDYFCGHQNFSFIILQNGEEFPKSFIEGVLNDEDFMMRGTRWAQAFDYGPCDKQLEANRKFIEFVELYFSKFCISIS